MADETVLSAEHLAWYRAADAAYSARKLKEALKLFHRALKAAPGDVDTLWAIADCHSDLGGPRKAERFYRMARAAAPWPQRGDLLYNLANALLDQGRPAAVLKLYRRVPRSAASYLQSRINMRVARRRWFEPCIEPTPGGAAHDDT